MSNVIELGKLTRNEKLQAMEALSDDLTRLPEAYESPDWHGEVLAQRERDLREGKDEFIPLEDAKRILRASRQ